MWSSRVKIKFKDGLVIDYLESQVDGVLFTNDGAELIDDNATEYLYKVDGEYKLTTNKYNAGVIEVPKGATMLYTCGNDINLIFEKDGFNLVIGIDSDWDATGDVSYEEFKSQYPLTRMLWQRDIDNNELPFIDSEDTVKVTIDELRETLKERQSNYGDFKDVANTTQSLLDNFPLGRMSAIQKEALHMICSKLARIANGDPNHKDSWHDIAGYARLVEDSL